MKCIVCGKEFHGRPNYSKFCSNDCRYKYYKTDKWKITVSKNVKESRKRNNLPVYETIIDKTCPFCGKHFQTKDPKKKFCNRHCSAMYNGYHSKNRKLSDQSKINIRQGMLKSDKCSHIFQNKKIETCRICGNEKGQCKHPDICKFLKTTTLDKVLVKLGFDKLKLGSNEVYLEFEKLQQLLMRLYQIDKLSLVEITEQYSLSSPSALLSTFKFLKIETRNSKDSILNSLIKGRWIPTFKGIPHSKKSTYKQGWHTTWDNFKVFYRSSYELKYAEYLDSIRLHYTMENLQIPYYHQIEDKMKISVPDFYIPSLNLIVEIKSEFTYCRRDMISRFASYKKNGYDYKLIIEGKDVGKILPPTSETFYSYIKSYRPEILDLYKSKDI